MNKVKIKKDLAALIEKSKKGECDLYFLLDQVYTTYGDYAEFSSYEPEEIASAWINGYEVIETIEEKIMERILQLQDVISSANQIMLENGYSNKNINKEQKAEIKGLEFAYDLLMEKNR